MIDATWLNYWGAITGVVGMLTSIAGSGMGGTWAIADRRRPLTCGLTTVHCSSLEDAMTQNRVLWQE